MTCAHCKNDPTIRKENITFSLMWFFCLLFLSAVRGFSCNTLGFPPTPSILTYIHTSLHCCCHFSLASEINTTTFYLIHNAVSVFWLLFFPDYVYLFVCFLETGSHCIELDGSLSLQGAESTGTAMFSFWVFKNTVAVLLFPDVFAPFILFLISEQFTQLPCNHFTD